MAHQQAADRELLDRNALLQQLRRRQLDGMAAHLAEGLNVVVSAVRRDPENPMHFWVNPFGVSFRLMRVSDLLLVNHEGEILHGDSAQSRQASHRDVEAIQSHERQEHRPRVPHLVLDDAALLAARHRAPDLRVHAA